MSKWPVLLLVESLAHGGCERDATKIAVGLDRSRFEPHVAVFHSGGPRTAQLEAAGVPILSLPLRSFVNSSVMVAGRMMGAYIRQHGIKTLFIDAANADFLGNAKHFQVILDALEKDYEPGQHYFTLP